MEVPVPQPVRRIGRYELYGEFARGGMASVHLGRLVGPVGFARTVAIKRLHPGYASDPSVVRMFIDEARVASRIHHPNVVPIADVLAEGGDLFLVMDYIKGVSLAAILKAASDARRALPLPVVLAIATGLLSGLEAAHEAKAEDGEPLHVVHRDVSPQNVIVGEDGIARVLDFGVAKATSRMQSTAEGQIKGKLAYMSPEQLASGDVDRRSDVFSAGIVLWEMLTLEPLFGRSEPGAVITAVLTGAIDPPSARRAEVPAALDAAVTRALARDREVRFSSALDLVRALEAAGPAASPREVGAWLAEVAPAALARAGAAAADLEQASIVTGPVVAAPPPTALPPSSSSSPSIATASSPLDPIASPPARSRRGAAFVAAGLVLAGGAAWVGSVVLGRDPPSVVRSSAAVAEASAPVVAAVVSVAPTPPPADEPVEAASAAPASPKRAVTRGAPRPRPAGKTPSSRADCRVLNADGTFGYRPECLK